MHTKQVFSFGIEYHHIHHFDIRVPGYRLERCDAEGEEPCDALRGFRHRSSYRSLLAFCKSPIRLQTSGLVWTLWIGCGRWKACATVSSKDPAPCLHICLGVPITCIGSKDNGESGPSLNRRALTVESWTKLCDISGLSTLTVRAFLSSVQSYSGFAKAKLLMAWSLLDLVPFGLILPWACRSVAGLPTCNLQPTAPHTISANFLQ